MSRSRFTAGCLVLGGWLGGAWLLACSSFGSAVADVDGSAEGSVAEGGEAGQAPPCHALDTSCDPSNCGTMGHSCLGGACTAGQCQPAVLATFMTSSMLAPVLDSTRVVVVTQGPPNARVQWCAKTGCGAGPQGTDLPSPATGEHSLASDGTNAYVSTIGGNGAGVFRIDQAGRATAITKLDGTFQNADLLAIDGSDVLFLNNYQVGPVGVYRVPNDGGTPTQIVPVTTSQRWGSLAVTPGRVFVADFATIDTCAGATCAGFTEYASPSVTSLDITRLVTDGNSLFWSSDQTKLLTCPVGDRCAAPSMIAGPTELQGSVPITLSIQGPDLFITTEAGKIFTCPAASCGSATFKLVTTDEVVVGAAAADDQAVYWVGRARIDAGGGVQAFRLMRITK